MRADTRQNINAAEKLASEFLETIQVSGNYLRRPIEQLAEMATSQNEIRMAEATKAIFASLVERLADSFDPRAVPVYNRLMAQLIQHCRKTERGSLLDERLNKFKMIGEGDLIARAEKLNNVQKLGWSQQERSRVKRIIILSRVTIGADVAVTSVIIERLKHEFPDAEIALAGGGKVSEIFGGDRRLSFHSVGYVRAGTTIDRLLAWNGALVYVHYPLQFMASDEYLIIDPDSRLTQLGLLPFAGSKSIFDQSDEIILPANNYLFFPSRLYGSDTRKSLGELTALWLDEIFGTSRALLPRVSLPQKDIETGAEVVRRMRASGAKQIVAINFGIGENPAKRLGDEFERLLVSGLIQQGASVILDKGFGEEEEKRADEVIEHVKNTAREGRAICVIEADEESLEQMLGADDKLQTDMLVWRGRIGLFAALISQSDLYTGYDSAFQHIAASLGLPCIDIFAGFSSPRMVDRWRPTGPRKAQVLAVDTLNHQPNTDTILSDVLALACKLQ